MATELQIKKFEKFEAGDLKNDCVKFLNQIIETAGLSLEEIGKTWGVTVFVNSATHLRVNVGNWEFASVRVNPKNPEGIAMFCVIGEPRITMFMPLSTKFKKSSNTIEDEYSIWVKLGKDSTKILKNENIAKLAGEAADAMRRGLPNPNWHNPLTEALIRATT